MSTSTQHTTSYTHRHHHPQHHQHPPIYSHIRPDQVRFNLSSQVRLHHNHAQPLRRRGRRQRRSRPPPRLPQSRRNDIHLGQCPTHPTRWRASLHATTAPTFLTSPSAPTTLEIAPGRAQETGSSGISRQPFNSADYLRQRYSHTRSAVAALRHICCTPGRARCTYRMRWRASTCDHNASPVDLDKVRR